MLEHRALIYVLVILTKLLLVAWILFSSIMYIDTILDRKNCNANYIYWMVGVVLHLNYHGHVPHLKKDFGCVPNPYNSLASPGFNRLRMRQLPQNSGAIVYCSNLPFNV